MITNDIYEAREEILEATALSWNICQILWRFHPLGSTLIDMPITKAMARGRDIKIQAAPDMVLKRFIEMSERINEDVLVSETLATAKCYGKAAIIVGQRDVSPDTNLDITTLNESTFFNVIDPLNIGNNSTQNNQNPNTKGFLQARGEAQALRMINVAGTSYNSSRFSEFFNPFEKLLYLNFNSSALSYAPPSVFERPFPYLKQLLKNDIAIEAGNEKVGAIIHKKAFAEHSYLEQANRSVMGAIVDKIKNLFTGGVAVIGAGDSIETIDLKNFSESLTTTSETILERIAMSSSDGIPVSMLRNAMLGRGLSEGDNDKTKEDEVILKHQKHLKSIYHFFDPFIQRMAWNDKDFYASVQQQHPEYQKISHARAIQMWQSSFEWEWKPISEPTQKELSDDAKVKAELSQGLIQLIQAVQLPPEIMLGLVETHVQNINDLGILENKFYFDADDIKANMQVEEMEQQLLAITNPQAAQQQQLAAQAGAQPQ